MTQSAPQLIPIPPVRMRPPYLTRGLRSLAFSAFIGTGLWALRGQSFWYTMAYSLSIGLACWFCIDTARLVIARWLRRHAGEAGPADGDDWPGWPWMIGVVVVGSVIGFSAGTGFVNWLTGESSPSLLAPSNLRQALALLLLALVPSVVITYFFYSRATLTDRDAAVQTAQRQAAEHQLKLLESQLEPHMLFNTLANLRVLIGVDPPRAQAMLDQLIAFMRATLSGSRASQHPLRAEFARLADYLALMQVRMGGRLQSHFDLPDALAEVPVPPLLLQPLVENCIKHGLEPAIAGGRIDVSAAREDGQLVLRVRDTGAGFDAGDGEGAGFGLMQVRERLATLYGARASLTLRSAGDAEGGTLAVIRLPLPAP